MNGEQIAHRTLPIQITVISTLVALIIGFVMGQKVSSNSGGPHIVIADKGAVLLEAILQHPNASPKDMQNMIEQPITRIMKKYSDQGYMVINTTKDDNGNVCIDALPKGGIKDITQELRIAVSQGQRSK